MPEQTPHSFPGICPFHRNAPLRMIETLDVDDPHDIYGILYQGKCAHNHILELRVDFGGKTREEFLGIKGESPSIRKSILAQKDKNHKVREHEEMAL